MRLTLFIPILGTEKIKYVEENVTAVHMQRSEQEDTTVRKTIEPAGIAGERHPPQHLEFLHFYTPPKNL
jgi:hypothetical protein